MNVTEEMVEAAANAFVGTLDLDDIYVGDDSDLTSVVIDGRIDLATALRAALQAALSLSPPECAGCTYSMALNLIKNGTRMRRIEWRPNKWVQLASPHNSLSYLEMELSDGRKAPYTPSRCDQFIDDWVLSTLPASPVESSTPAALEGGAK